jgi:hypothetical protein
MADLTLYGIDDKVLSEFEAKFVKVYFKDDVCGAVETLMRNVVADEAFLKARVKSPLEVRV